MRLGETDAALEAFRQRLDRLLEHAVQMQALDHVLEALRAARTRQAAHVGNEIEELARRHFAVARRAFGQIAEYALGRERLVHHIVAADAGAAGSRREEAGDHFHRRRFAGAVRAEEAEHLPGFHLEGDAVDGGEVAVALGQLPGFDHVEVTV